MSEHNWRIEVNNVKPLIRRARKLWDNPMVEPSVNRYNRKAWVRSVLRLGDRWLLARNVQRNM